MSNVGDMYLNATTGNTYRCTLSGAAAVAMWVYVSNITGPQPDITDGSITNAKLANMANNTIKGNVSGGVAAPSDLTVAQVRGIVTEGTTSVDSIADGDKFVIEDVSATAGVRTKHVLWSAIKTALGLIFAPSASVKTNLVINGNFSVNQLAKSGTVTLAAGKYGHDMWKAGTSGCTYTFSTSENITTLTISAGSLIQVVDGMNLQSGTVCLSWAGTSQGKIGAGSYSASGITGTATGGTNLNIEFNTGTLSKVQLNYGSVSLPFVTIPFGDELRQCQRYYEQSYVYGISPGSVTDSGIWFTNILGNSVANGARWQLGKHPVFLVTKRATPTVTLYLYEGTSGQWAIGGGNRATGASASTTGFYTTNATGESVTPTAGEAYGHWVANARL